MSIFTMSLCPCALAAVTLFAAPTPAALIVSEVMFNPSSSDSDWEWVEVYNSGSTAVDLAGWVLDDDDGTAFGAANIASGRIAAGGAAVLYDADAVSAADFAAAWGPGINLVGATGFSGLANSGDRIGLWSDLVSYGTRDFSQAVVDFTYGSSSPWPGSDNAGSMFLAALSMDANDGANWSLSAVGDGMSFMSLALGGNSGGDIGSPGLAVPGPGVAAIAIPTLICRTRRRRA